MAETSEQVVMRQAAAESPENTAISYKSANRTHLYDIDVVRTLTAICVVGVHVGAHTLFLATTPQEWLLQSGVLNALHFTREIFVAITSFVLVYAYANRPFSVRTFAKKRAIGVLLPYVAWTIFYDMVQRTLGYHRCGGPCTCSVDLLNGTASFQLYYILSDSRILSDIPWFLGWIQRVGRHPWQLLGVSFALQLFLMTVEYWYILVPPFVNTSIGHYIFVNQDRYLPLYQFYVVLGGVTALYIKDVRAFLLRYGGWTIAGTPTDSGGPSGNHGQFSCPIPAWALPRPSVCRAISRAIIFGLLTVFQPAMQFYVCGGRRIPLLDHLSLGDTSGATASIRVPLLATTLQRVIRRLSVQGYFLDSGRDGPGTLPAAAVVGASARRVDRAGSGCGLFRAVLDHAVHTGSEPAHWSPLYAQAEAQAQRSKDGNDGRRMTSRPAWADALAQAMTDPGSCWAFGARFL